MPSAPASRCCSRFSKWCCSAGWLASCLTGTASAKFFSLTNRQDAKSAKSVQIICLLALPFLSALATLASWRSDFRLFFFHLANNLHLLGRRKLIGFPGNNRRRQEILSRRRRRSAPFQPRQVPWVCLSQFAVTHRPNQINERNQQAHTEDRRARRRQHIEHLELRRISVVAPRHAEVTRYKLRQERQVEPDENYQRRKSAPTFGIHAPADFRPPVVQAAEITKERAAHHDVVEVGHDEVSVAHVHVHRESRQEESGHA